MLLHMHIHDPNKVCLATEIFLWQISFDRVKITRVECLIWKQLQIASCVKNCHFCMLYTIFCSRYSFWSTDCGNGSLFIMNLAIIRKQFTPVGRVFPILKLVFHSTSDMISNYVVDSKQLTEKQLRTQPGFSKSSLQIGHKKHTFSRQVVNNLNRLPEDCV